MSLNQCHKAAEKIQLYRAKGKSTTWKITYLRLMTNDNYFYDDVATVVNIPTLEEQVILKNVEASMWLQKHDKVTKVEIAPDQIKIYIHEFPQIVLHKL